MSNLREFVEAVRTGGRIPRDLTVEAANYIEARLNAAAKGGQISKRPPVKTDTKSVQVRNRVKRFRERSLE